LGRQDIGVDYSDIQEITGVNYGQGPVSDAEYLKLLGFDKVDSLEYNVMDGATIAHDLNEPLPSSLYHKFDWIIDGGTLEHCFDVKEFMFSMINLLKPGGHILHINPSQGSCNHGMFNFQPTFYFSFYGANNFTQLECDLLEMQVKPKDIFGQKNAKGKVFPVKNYNNLEFFSEYPTYNMFHAVKSADKPSFEIKKPIQEFYYRIFKEKEKMNGGMIADEIYHEIRGDIRENTAEYIQKNAHLI
jgi:SAM-dependent methyltransferase